MQTLHRYRIDRKPIGANIGYYNWIGGLWILQATEEATYSTVWYSTTRDNYPWSMPIMQDCVTQKLRGKVEYLSATPYTDDASQSHLAVWLFPGRMALVPTEYVLWDALRRSNATHSLSGICPDAIELHAVYNQQVYTNEIKIQESPFKSDFSIWFLIVDLIELPRLAKSFLANKALLRKLQRQEVLRPQTLKEVSGSYLATQFGALPTLADVREFAQLICKVGLQYSKLNPRLRHGFTAYAPNKSVLPAEHHYKDMNAHIATGDFQVRLTADVSNAVLFGTAKYYFDCPELSGFLNRCRQLVDALGILDPAAIWDAIPFSFLVDWIYPVGTWLHKNLKPQLFPASVVFCDFCESIGRDIRSSVTVSWRYPDPASSGNSYITRNELMCSSNVFQYTRVRKFPVNLKLKKFELLPVNSPVRITRFFIGSALGAQHTTNTVRKRLSARYGDRFTGK